MDYSKLENIDQLTRDDIVAMLKSDSAEEMHLLFEKAREVRSQNFGDVIKMRGNLKFTNYCEANCLYCQNREDNFSLKRYRLSGDEIIETVKLYSNIGIDSVILQSGIDSYYDTDMISYIIYSIRQNNDLSITLSLGERGFDEYNTWKIAGAERYVLKHKTANRNLYKIYHSKDRLTSRLNHLRLLKRLGYKIGTGIIIGLPYQTMEDIADDILLCKELGVDVLTVSPFNPMPFTPYQNKEAGNRELVSKTIAVIRLIMQNVDIQTSSVIESGNINVKEKCLNSGANIVVFNFEPNTDYDFHSSISKAREDNNIPAYKKRLINIIKDLN